MSISNNRNDIPPGVSPPPYSHHRVGQSTGVQSSMAYTTTSPPTKSKHTRASSGGGPPSLTIYWNNCAAVTGPDHFFATGCYSRHTVIEYLARVGEMLRKGKCTVSSLNATKYAVNAIVMTDLSSEEFKGLLREHGLINSS